MSEEKKSAFEPPKCPECGANLLSVHETVYETYTFQPKTGNYREAGWGETEISCPDCGADLYEVFPNGACNHSSTVEKS